MGALNFRISPASLEARQVFLSSVDRAGDAIICDIIPASGEREEFTSTRIFMRNRKEVWRKIGDSHGAMLISPDGRYVMEGKQEAASFAVYSVDNIADSLPIPFAAYALDLADHGHTSFTGDGAVIFVTAKGYLYRIELESPYPILRNRLVSQEDSPLS